MDGFSTMPVGSGLAFFLAAAVDVSIGVNPGLNIGASFLACGVGCTRDTMDEADMGWDGCDTLFPSPQAATFVGFFLEKGAPDVEPHSSSLRPPEAE